MIVVHAADQMEIPSEPEQIAVIAMAGRFPGASNVEEFWQNLKDGVESIKPFAEEELRASGIDDETLQDPFFVNAGAVMPDADAFDAEFFGISAREAQVMDPQHRVFLETAWQALEDAGYDPEGFPGLIGIFGGVAPNTYFQHNLVTRPDVLRALGRYPVMIGSEKEYAVSRIAFKLDLRGPAVSVNTACSTSGVAVHLACQSLLSGECDMALAGGARIAVPLQGGYMYEEGGILSPDGHCHAFDVGANGTVVGSGVAILVLKRLSGAIADGDHVYAVLKGSAINNDGSQKVGFTAPSVQGQAAVIEEALAIAEVDPDSIGYVETHGTGTALGDPIEIAALTKAFRKWTDRTGYCPIGSVKTNIGHLDAGAGAAGMIKAILALQHKRIPPSLSFTTPNPQIDFRHSPFFVNTRLSRWPSGTTPRRASVSSFGLGGTNAHLILEEAPEIEPAFLGRTQQLLLLSARSDAALAQATRNLANHLQQHPQASLADIAYTLQTGRRAFSHRRMLACQDVQDAISALGSVEPRRVRTSVREPVDRDVVFMFSGQGAQYANMALGIYEEEPRFRQVVDQCAQILESHLSLDLRQLLYPDQADREEATRMLRQTAFTQPALFTIEYAIAMLWMSWGIYPRSMVGHSIGEYVAACLAGVFTLEEALSLVSARGRLMQELPAGSMLVVPLPEEQVQPYVDDRISLAVINGPSLCVVSGEEEAIRDLQLQLQERGIESRHLHTSHAFHSQMMAPILEPFVELVNTVKLNAPRIPFVSNVTGTWITPDDATDPGYWARHLRQTVRFSDCLQTLLQDPNRVLLEVGPGRTLATLAMQHPARDKRQVVLASTRHPKEETPDLAFLLDTLGQLWLAGVPVDWSGFYAHERRRRVSLPTYPFERKRYWISPGKQIRAAVAEQAASPQTPEAAVALVDRDADGSADPHGMPCSDVQRTLAEMWHRLLGVDGLTTSDNFFEIGGSSLLATRLFTQIAQIYGKRLPLSTIFEAPTIGQLASILDRDAGPSAHTSLVKVQEGESRPAFFCLPGNLGNVFADLGYLSRHLGLDQPVYGLQDGIGHPSAVPALAAHYVEDICRSQPGGSYLLGGVCSGGVVAFEMARQLRQRGCEVALLALVEPASLPLSGARSYLDLFSEIWHRFLRRRSARSQETSRLSLAEKAIYVRLKLKLLANLWGLKRYVPQAYRGHLHLYLTRESLEHSPRPRWCDLADGGASVHEIPGTHRTITGDDVPIDERAMRVLGGSLRECIDTALQGEASDAAAAAGVDRVTVGMRPLERRFP